jgi:hypothetical protein
MADWTQLSPSHESRGGAQVRSLIVHTAEGSTTAASLANFLCNPANQVSYHDVADDANSVHVVDYSEACWSTRSANHTSENYCLTGFSAWPRTTWLAHGGMLERCAAWIAARAKARGIPIVKLSSADVAADRPGVFGHVNWTEGKHDGTHTDPGPGFPWDVVIERAHQLAGGAPSPAPAPAPAPAGRPNLHEGDTSALVWSLQLFMNRTFSSYSHIDAGPGPTSRLGPQTIAAVEEFQRRVGIPTAPPFEVGPKTWAALEKYGFR